MGYKGSRKDDSVICIVIEIAIEIHNDRDRQMVLFRLKNVEGRRDEFVCRERDVDKERKKDYELFITDVCRTGYVWKCVR